MLNFAAASFVGKKSKNGSIWISLSILSMKYFDAFNK